jgi:hypothetical protein
VKKKSEKKEKGEKVVEIRNEYFKPRHNKLGNLIKKNVPWDVDSKVRLIIEASSSTSNHRH